MRLNPHLLADAIADAMVVADGERPMPSHTREQLARALSRGQGVAIDGRTVYILLRDVWAADDPAEPGFLPTLIVGRIPSSQYERRFRTTATVAITFRGRVRRYGKKPARAEHKVPTASDSSALVPLGGVGADPTDVVQHGRREIKWYGLNFVPVGGIIYEVAADKTVLLYQRVDSDHWIMLQRLDGTRDIVNLPTVLHNAVRDFDEEIEGIAPMPGEPVLLWVPHSAKQ